MVHFTSAMLFAPVHGGCYIIYSVGIEYSWLPSKPKFTLANLAKVDTFLLAK